MVHGIAFCLIRYEFLLWGLKLNAIIGIQRASLKRASPVVRLYVVISAVAKVLVLLSSTISKV